MQRALLAVWTWLAFALISGVGFVGCALIFLTTSWFDPTRKHTGAAIRAVGRAMFWAAPAWTVRTVTPLPPQLPARTVCICNHASNVDPFVLLVLPWEMKYLAKSGLFLIPFVGWGMKIAGDIPLVRGSSKSVRAALVKARFYVESGMPVLFFPEGTRSNSGDLLPFKEGAFRLAIETQASVLPIALSGTAELLQKGDWRPSVAVARVAVGQPISTAGLRAEDAGRLRDQCHAAVSELLGGMRAGPVAPGPKA